MVTIIKRFEPGDGTAYYVLFHRLSDREKHGEYGGADVLFGFGAMSDTPRNFYPFVTTPGSFLHEDYFQSKMGIAHPWTRVAAMIVFSHLTGRPAGGPVYDRVAADILRDWRSTWSVPLEEWMPEVWNPVVGEARS